MERPIALAALMSLLVTIPAHNASAAESNAFSELISMLAPPPADEALNEIPDLGRKLLALRSYVRAGSKLDKRWSWTEEEIKAFQGSSEQEALLEEVAAVKSNFAEANPGCEIYANTKVRSLDVQIDRWNKNESIRFAADEILAAWREKFGTDTSDSGKLDPKKIRNWLTSFTSTIRANIAAPGLTAHGQGHAIDFQIMQNGQIIAGADSRQIETVWRDEKWDAKLKESIAAAGPSFDGPLTNPDEPWHYDYEPDQTVAQSKIDGK